MQTMRTCSVRQADVFGTRLACHRHSSRHASLRMAARSDSALIINTKGGGHAFLGLHLARRLLKDGHSVSILNDGDEVKISYTCMFSSMHIWLITCQLSLSARHTLCLSTRLAIPTAE
jgi:hypothetical protein